MTPGSSLSKSIARVALAGNPNSGKTSLFNALTGLRYKVANYPGVTVEKKEGEVELPNGQRVMALDLPGIYSLSAFAPDEVVAEQVLTGHFAEEPCPDLVVSVVDASNLERSLYFTSQLIDLGLPIILALNMSDVAAKMGIVIRTELLARELDVPVVAIVAKTHVGVPSLRLEIQALLETRQHSSRRYAWLPASSPLRAAALAAAKAGGERESEGQLRLGLRALSQAPTTAELDVTTAEASARFVWIRGIIERTVVVSADAASGRLRERVDHFLTHRLFGPLAFFVVMAGIFQAVFLWAEAPMAWIEAGITALGETLRGVLPPGIVQSLLIDGVLAGVGSVLAFIPQISLLFLCLGVLEDSGYLARAAFVMDRLMRVVGLQGRSFVPLLSSFACAIPGILATRTIPSMGDRLATILVAPLMSCSARLPVYALLISAFIPQRYLLGVISLQGTVLFGLYLLGIIAAAVVALLLKHTLLKHTPSLFVMEMPRFRRPSVRVVFREIFDRVLLFVQKAGTIILACSVILWFLASFPEHPELLGTERVKASYAGQIGQLVEPLIRPLGYDWAIGVALLASIAAREVFVSALATVYHVGDSADVSSTLGELLQRMPVGDGQFSIATALSLMVFFVFACQCISTVAVCRRETGSWKWPMVMVVYMTALAYGAAFVTFRLALSWSGGAM